MRRIGVTTLACIWVMAAAAPASVATARESATTMEKVVVTAGRTEEKAANVTQAVTVISREEIEKHQYQDLGRMLRNYGVSVNSYTANESLSQISIRGIKTPLLDDPMTSPVLVLIDGRRAGTANVSMIPMVSIDHIEIIRGPAAVQYGTSAVGGVVNIILKRGGEDPHLTLEAGGGSWDTWKTQAGASGSFQALDFAGGVSWLTVGRDYKTGDGRTYPNTEINSRTAYALNLGWNFLEEQRLGVTLLGLENDKMGNYSALDSPWGGTPRAYTDRSNHSVDVAYDGGHSDYGLQWKLRYFNTRDKYRYEDPASFYHSTAQSNNQGSQVQASWTRGLFTLTGGVDWLDNDYRAHQNQSKSQVENVAGFLLGKAVLLDERIILSAGLRYDDYTLKFEDKERDLDNTSFSVGAAWHALDWLTFRANWGESYRVPTGMEVAGYRDPSFGTEYYGDPNLKPEKGLGWDIGWEINYKTLNLGLTYFQIDYKNKIAYRSEGRNYQYYNIDGKTKYRGMEAQAGVDVGEFFEWPFLLRPYLNLTRLFTYKDASGHTLQNVRDTDLAYGLNFQYPSIGLEADLRFTYFGHQKETNYNTYEYPNPVVRTGGFTTADFFISKTLWEWEKAGTVKVTGEVRNIFDKEYSTMLGYPMPGRSFFLGLRYDY